MEEPECEIWSFPFGDSKVTGTLYFPNKKF